MRGYAPFSRPVDLIGVPFGVLKIPEALYELNELYGRPPLRGTLQSRLALTAEGGDVDTIAKLLRIEVVRRAREANKRRRNDDPVWEIFERPKR